MNSLASHLSPSDAVFILTLCCVVCMLIAAFRNFFFVAPPNRTIDWVPFGLAFFFSIGLVTGGPL